MTNEQPELKEVKIASFDNDIIAEMLIEILEDNGIVVHSIYQGMGSAGLLYFGASQTGVELYVAEDQFDKAKALLAEFNEAPTEPLDDDFIEGAPEDPEDVLDNLPEEEA